MFVIRLARIRQHLPDLPRPPSPRRLVGDLWALAYANRFYALTLSGRVPTEIRNAPTDVWPGDAARGKAIMDGAFAYGTRMVSPDEAVWRGTKGGEDAAVALHGFGWLRDLRTAGGEAARTRARDLTRRWIDGDGSWQSLAWRADVMGERLANWLSALSFLSPEPGDGLYAQVLESAARQARHLSRAVAPAEPGPPAFLALKGLIYCALCLPGHEPRLDPALNRLEGEVLRQVLPDGGHIQRSPSRHLSVLQELIDIRAALTTAQAEVPGFLQRAIDRMTPMVRALRHGDGRLALFNNGGEVDAGRIDLVLARADVRASPLATAPHSGFYRLANGPALIVCDFGAPAPRGSDDDAHAGTLSFEMSVRKERLIVNCGAHGDDDPHWRDALRATAAHSTVTVDATNSADVWPGGGLGRRRPHQVKCTRREAEGATWIEATHDGYQRPFGLVHVRRLYLSAKGDDVRGEDTLMGPGGHEYAARFHLHPQVGASLVQDATAVLLRLPSGAGWRFRAVGGPIRLEDSVYLGTPGKVQRTQQMVIYGPLNGNGATVKWALRQEGGGGRGSGGGED
jgi:uncharacterized heparinase superfamily protein